MGTRGPVPRPKDSLRGHRSKAELSSVTRIPGAANSDEAEHVIALIEENDYADWHPIAQRVWDSVKTSGQRALYQPSDWAILGSLMEDLSQFKRTHIRSGQMHSSLMSALTSLLLTEGDRRRLSIELTLPDTGDEDAITAGGKEVVKWAETLLSSSNSPPENEPTPSPRESRS